MTGKTGKRKATEATKAPETAPPGDEAVFAKYQHVTLQLGGQGALFGCRVPYEYFCCTGYGDTNEGGGTDPWETGSYDLALEMAKIQDFNMVTYTSCIPAEAKEVKREDVDATFHHGAVLESIQAIMHGNQGDRISAGVGMMKVRRKSDNTVIGGWAAEYKGHATRDGVEEVLKRDLKGMYERRFQGRLDDHELVEEKFIIQVHEVKNSYGSVLASVCFCSYIFPIASPTHNVDRS